MSEHLWTFKDVSLEGISLPRLKNVSLEIRPGVTAILGQSGAGKTSLINLLTRFEKTSSGQLKFDVKVGENELPLFWVPQDDGLWPEVNVYDHLRIVSEKLDSHDKMIVELLEIFHLEKLSDRKPEALSQGERSRLSVARALCSSAKVIVMDEPLAHVDYRSSLKYWDAIQEFLQKNGSSLVFASHHSEMVLRESEFCICLEQGEIIYEGKTEELYHNPPDEKTGWFLGPLNWLEVDEKSTWLKNDEPQTSAGIRPEKLEIQDDEQSDLVLTRNQFCGKHSEVTLESEKNQERKTFFTRAPSKELLPGKRVRLSILTVLLMLFSFAGCETQEGLPNIPLKNVDTWMLPVKGKSIPTPRSMTVSPENELYILDDAGRVIVYDLNGKLLRQWDMPESDVGNPEGICILPDKRVVVADTHYHRVVFFDQQGKVLGMFGKEGTGPREFIFPVDVTHDDQGNIYVAEYGYNDRLQKFTPEGEYVLEMGKPGTGNGEFQRMSGVAWKDGFLYISDAINNRIQKFSDDGNFIEIYDLSDYGTQLDYPYDIALAPEGGFWIIEYGSGNLTRFDQEGKLKGRFGKTGSELNQFRTPWGLTVTNDHRVFVADTGNRRVVELSFE